MQRSNRRTLKKNGQKDKRQKKGHHKEEKRPKTQEADETDGGQKSNQKKTKATQKPMGKQGIVEEDTRQANGRDPPSIRTD